MPRNAADAWREYRVVTAVNGKKLSATCKHCGKVWSAPNATRCSKHLELCIKLPSNLRKAYGLTTNVIEEDDEFYDVRQQSLTTDSASASVVGSLAVAVTTPSRLLPPPQRGSGSSTSTLGAHGDGPSPLKRQRSVSSYVDTMSREESNRIDEALARAVYAKGLPLSVFEGKEFAAAFKLMRPSYEKPPSRFKLGSALLDKEYNIISCANKDKIKSSDCKALMLDGCGNVNREQIINFIVTTPEPVFYSYVLPNAGRETADFLSGEVRKILTAEDPKTFFLIMTDNASAMRAMWGVIEEEFPHIVGAGCAGHCFNLLFKDLVDMPALDRVVIVSKRIIKSIRNSYLNLNTFRKKQPEKYGSNSIQLKLPPKTRWGYSVIMLNSLMRNKAAVQETIVNEDLEIDPDVRAWALDLKLWERVKFALEMLKTLHASITIVESNRALLSDVLFLQQKYSNAVLANLRALRFKNIKRAEVEKLLKDREEFTVKVIHKASFLLDPRYREYEYMLSPSDIVDIIVYIGKLCKNLGLDEGRVIASLGEYRTRSGFFACSAVWEAAKRVAPRVWWKGVCSGEAIAPIAWRLLSLPPTSAECERDWSMRSFIHSKARNRLNNVKVQKLVVCKKGLASQNITSSSPFFCVEEIISYIEKYLDTSATGGDKDPEHTVDDDVEESEESDAEVSSDEEFGRPVDIDWSWSDDETSEGDEEIEQPNLVVTLATRTTLRRAQQDQDPPAAANVRRSTRNRR